MTGEIGSIFRGWNLEKDSLDNPGQKSWTTLSMMRCVWRYRIVIQYRQTLWHGVHPYSISCPFHLFLESWPDPIWRYSHAHQKRWGSKTTIWKQTNILPSIALASLSSVCNVSQTNRWFRLGWKCFIFILFDIVTFCWIRRIMALSPKGTLRCTFEQTASSSTLCVFQETVFYLYLNNLAPETHWKHFHLKTSHH